MSEPNPLSAAASPTRPTGLGGRALLERGLDSSSGPGFVRERLALLAKTLFLVSLGFYLFLLASLTLIGGAPFTAVVRGPVALGHLCASLTMGVVWLVTSRARLSLLSLGALDVLAFTVAGVFLSFMTVADEGQILQVLLALLVTVMVRAILMPSRPGRTALISALVFAPTVVVCIARHHPTAFLPGFSPGYQKLHMTLNTVLWSVLGTIVATIVSRVLYGLRRQVAEASELGQYLLEEKIGGGGMGEVWRARHRLLIRPAAIKLIRQAAVPGMSADPELLVRRFEREARATAALTSPHTVAALRLRRHRGRTAVLRDGAARRARPRHPGPAARAAAGGAGGPPPAPGLRRRCRTRTRTVWSTATSSRPTSWCAGPARRSTSSRCSTSGWSSSTAPATPTMSW